jgi:hypothetical protein
LRLSSREATSWTGRVTFSRWVFSCWAMAGSSMVKLLLVLVERS